SLMKNTTSVMASNSGAISRRLATNVGRSPGGVVFSSGYNPEGNVSWVDVTCRSAETTTTHVLALALPRRHELQRRVPEYGGNSWDVRRRCPVHRSDAVLIGEARTRLRNSVRIVVIQAQQCTDSRRADGLAGFRRLPAEQEVGGCTTNATLAGAHAATAFELGLDPVVVTGHGGVGHIFAAADQRVWPG